MINITVYQDVGPAVAGRGTSTVEVMDFNMKNSGTYSVAYYPTDEGSGGAPLVRPTVVGDQVFSYPVYTFFKIDGATETLKNMRFIVSLESDPQTDKAQLFYKNTNVYSTPSAAYDGSMMLMADTNGVVLTPVIYPMISTVGPHLATSRQTTYQGGFPYYTNYFVTQMRVNRNCVVGNTAEFKLRFEAFEFEA